MTSEQHEDLIYAAFFFIDIVGLSNPILSTETQRTKIKILNEIIYSCKTFSESPRENVLILPTGDGMLICFKNGLEQPIKLAIECHEKLFEYNQKVTKVEQIATRIGCNIGHVFVVKDIYGNINLWGPGAILARRVMDLGNENHILLSNEIVNDLLEISADYEKIFHPLHNFGIKHGDNLLVYSAYGNDFGNSTTPREKTIIKTTIPRVEKHSKCEKIIFNIIVKEQNQPVSFERYYYLSNSSTEPVFEIIAGLTANSEEEFKDLNFKIFDEHNKELEISKIVAASSISKKIIINLPTPVFKSDSERLIKINYEYNQTKNIFENFFLIDANSFELNFSHYSNVDFSPQFYYIDNENGNKHHLDQEILPTKGVFITHRWKKSDTIDLKDMIRLEW